MSYEVGNSAYTQNTALTVPKTIADDQYVDNPYTKKLTANATISGATVVSGGTITFKTDTSGCDIAVGNGGAIVCGVRTRLFNITITDGGKSHFPARFAGRFAK